MLNNFFSIKKRNSTIKTEVIAGLTTFFAMLYILFVNTQMLAETGMPKGAVFIATAVSAAFATLLMGLYAKVPFALAPGMGLNAFFTYNIALGSGFG